MRFDYEVFHRDVRVVTAFYVDVLGFALEDPSDVSRDYAVVVRDGLRVGCTRHTDASGTLRPPPEGSEIVLRVADVHAEHRRVVVSGWRIADLLQQRPWGQIDFRVFDPTGQYIRITDGGDEDGAPVRTHP